MNRPAKRCASGRVARYGWAVLFLVVGTPGAWPQSETDSRAVIRLDGAIGFGDVSHRYTGPTGEREFIEAATARGLAMLTIGRTWVGYFEYGGRRIDIDDRSRDGDFEFYALDSLRFRSYTAGLGYQLELRRRLSMFFGVGGRIAAIQNDTEGRIPNEALTANLGGGIGVDLRYRLYVWDGRHFGFFFGLQGGVDFAPFRDADFNLERGGSWDVILLPGLTVRIP